MSTIQSELLSKPLPLADATTGSNSKPRVGIPDAEKAAKDFESVFTSMMLKEMRKTLEPGAMFGEDKSDIYGGMFDQFLGEHIAGAGGMGLAKMIQEALTRQAVTPQTASASPSAVN